MRVLAGLGRGRLAAGTGAQQLAGLGAGRHREGRLRRHLVTDHAASPRVAAITKLHSHRIADRFLCQRILQTSFALALPYYFSGNR